MSIQLIHIPTILPYLPRFFVASSTHTCIHFLSMRALAFSNVNTLLHFAQSYNALQTNKVVLELLYSQCCEKEAPYKKIDLNVCAVLFPQTEVCIKALCSEATGISSVLAWPLATAQFLFCSWDHMVSLFSFNFRISLKLIDLIVLILLNMYSINIFPHLE